MGSEQTPKANIRRPRAQVAAWPVFLLFEAAVRSHDHNFDFEDRMGLQWREQLSVGNDLIDSDHKYLIEIINKAEVSLKENNRAALLRILDELSAYGKTHFEREELIAHAVGYPGSARLHESHGKLVEALDKFREDIGGIWTADTATQFTTFLRDWLIQHLIKEDLPMKPWMVKHSPRFDPRA